MHLPTLCGWRSAVALSVSAYVEITLSLLNYSENISHPGSWGTEDKKYIEEKMFRMVYV